MTYIWSRHYQQEYATFHCKISGRTVMKLVAVAAVQRAAWMTFFAIESLGLAHFHRCGAHLLEPYDMPMRILV